MKRYRRFNIIVTVVIFVGFTLLGIFVFQLSYVVVPFVRKVSDVGNGDINAFVFRAFYKSRKAVMIFTDVYKLPVIVSAHGFQKVYVLCLK